MKEPKPDNGTRKMDCREIQAVLFDYMSRELGQGRSNLISRHLKHCRACQAEAAEIQATVDLLRRASREDARVPSRLSDEHRRRLFWRVAHPVLDWIYGHHIVVSVVVALLVIVMVAAATCRSRRRPPMKIYPVRIGLPGMTHEPMGPSGERETAPVEAGGPDSGEASAAENRGFAPSP